MISQASRTCRSSVVLCPTTSRMVNLPRSEVWVRKTGPAALILARSSPVQRVEPGLVPAVVQAEADEAQVHGGEELEAPVGFEPCLEEPGQADMLPDHGLQPFQAVGPDDEPELEGPEAAAELNPPVAEVLDLGDPRRLSGTRDGSRRSGRARPGRGRSRPSSRNWSASICGD